MSGDSEKQSVRAGEIKVSRTKVTKTKGSVKKASKSPAKTKKKPASPSAKKLGTDKDDIGPPFADINTRRSSFGNNALLIETDKFLCDVALEIEGQYIRSELKLGNIPVKVRGKTKPVSVDNLYVDNLRKVRGYLDTLDPESLPDVDYSKVVQVNYVLAHAVGREMHRRPPLSHLRDAQKKLNVVTGFFTRETYEHEEFSLRWIEIQKALGFKEEDTKQLPLKKPEPAKPSLPDSSKPDSKPPKVPAQIAYWSVVGNSVDEFVSIIERKFRVGSFEDFLAHAEGTKSAAGDVIEKYREALNKLSSQELALKSLEDQRLALEQTVRVREAQLTKSRDSITDLREKLMIETQGRQDISRQFWDLVNRCERSEDDIRNLDSYLRSTKASLEDRDDDIVDLCEELVNLGRQRIVLQNTLLQERERFYSLERDNRTAQLEFTSARKNVGKLQKQKDTLEARNGLLEKSVVDLRAELKAKGKGFDEAFAEYRNDPTDTSNPLYVFWKEIRDFYADAIANDGLVTTDPIKHACDELVKTSLMRAQRDFDFRAADYERRLRNKDTDLVGAYTALFVAGRGLDRARQLYFEAVYRGDELEARLTEEMDLVGTLRNDLQEAREQNATLGDDLDSAYEEN
ncbi:hypothetical protein ACFLZN_02070, partial [Nanoarchaeota archaeon]